jgi:hypothetical protein
MTPPGRWRAYASGVVGWFRRKRRRDTEPLSEGAGGLASEPDEGSPLAQAEEECPLAAGDYVTDGSSLFRVEHTLADERSGELYVELENCGTLELIVCSARALAARRLRCISPVGASKLTGGAVG